MPVLTLVLKSQKYYSEIADTIAMGAQSKGYKKVALMGTIPTMAASFYPEQLEKLGIECNTPNPLQREGAQAVILGCTEIPLLISEQNIPLPVLNSTLLFMAKTLVTALADF